MCPPAVAAAIPWIVGAITAASAVYGVVQQDQMAKRQNKAAQAQFDSESDRADRDAKDRANSLQSQALEEGTKFQQQKQKLALDALRSQAAARAASAESGVGGVTSIRSFIAEDISKDLARSDLDRGAEFSSFGASQQARGIETSRSDRITNAGFSFASNSRRRAGGLDYGVAGVSGALSGYSSGRNLANN